MSSEVNSLEILEIHPGIECDLNCIFCFRQGVTYESGYELLSKDCLKTLIDDFVAMGGCELFISGGLEPFSRPEIATLAILWAYEAGLKVKVYTNGVAKVLSEPQLQNILAFRTKQVRFSIHSTNPHTYHQITRTNPKTVALYSVVEKVIALVDTRPLTDGTEVGIGFLVLSENIHELLESAELWRDMGVDFFDLRFDTATKLSAGQKIVQEVEKFQNLADSGYFFPMRVNIGNYAHGKPRFASRCYAPFQKLVVDPFGLVWTCCLQAQPGFRPPWAILGDLKSDLLSTIIERVRDKFPRFNCQQCTPYEAKWNLNYEKLSPLKTWSVSCPQMAL
jgi:MoaA/NifB/PqqE/SkfB family radical SAM enzyme